MCNAKAISATKTKLLPQYTRPNQSRLKTIKLINITHPLCLTDTQENEIGSTYDRKTRVGIGLIINLITLNTMAIRRSSLFQRSRINF